MVTRNRSTPKPPAPKPAPTQSLAQETAPENSQFQGIPGTGRLMFRKGLDNGHFAWSGPLTLLDGKRLVMEATSSKENGFQVKVLDPVEKNWKLLGSFQMPLFGEQRRARDVAVPGVGPVKIWPGTTRDNLTCLKVQILNPQGRPANVAM